MTQPQSGTFFKLSWSHYVFLLRIENEQERSFYEIEAAENNWSLRELKRQFDSALYERLALSTHKKKVRQLAAKGQIIAKPEDAIKDPLILEFIGLDEKPHYSESDFEQAILDKLQHFLLELGKGIGQIQMYVNYYDREMRLPHENATVGLTLCRDKSEAVVEYTLPQDNEQIFASRYSTVLPDKESLKKLLSDQTYNDLLP